MSTLMKKKIIYREYYNSNNFKLLTNKLINKITLSKIITSNIEIMWINSVFENMKDKVFYEKNIKYSIIYKSLVLEKHVLDDSWCYVIHNKKKYKNRINNQ